MKKIFSLVSMIVSVTLFAQDTTRIAVDSVQTIAKVPIDRKPVQIFSSERVINANTTELVGKGKMIFTVTHNFDDIASKFGGPKTFFGLDNTTDVRIGFETGLGKNFDLITARAKGGGSIIRIFQLGFKWRWMQQTTDNSVPLSMALFGSYCFSTMTESNNPADDNYFKDFGDRSSQLLQLIVARKFGNVSLQVNPTFLTQGYVVPKDQKSIFAFGGAMRFPISKSGKFHILIDWFHPFRTDSSKAFLKATKNLTFHDPLSIGLEILTAGHIFHLNFTNARNILENRFIPRTNSNWGDGEFRWGFNLSRKFTLFREKKK